MNNAVTQITDNAGQVLGTVEKIGRFWDAVSATQVDASGAPYIFVCKTKKAAVASLRAGRQVD